MTKRRASGDGMNLGEWMTYLLIIKLLQTDETCFNKNHVITKHPDEYKKYCQSKDNTFHIILH